MPTSTIELPDLNVFPPDPKKVTVQGTPSDPPSVSLPMATLGVPIPYILGKQRVYAPNILWYGNLRPIIETVREVEESTIVEKEWDPFLRKWIETERPLITTTVTHSIVGYYVSMQFSLALGPDCKLTKIFVGDEEIWEGEAGPSREEITVPANETWLKGKVIFHGGAFDQAPDSFLANHIDSDALPGYVGICYAIATDIVANEIRGNGLSFEIERFPNPLGLDAADNRLNDDMNVASMLADYITSDWGGAGGGSGIIDTASFTSAAETLASEGIGGGLFIQNEVSSETVIKLLSNHLDGVVFVDPNTETIKLKLVRRNSFDPLTAFRLNGSNVSNVNSWDRTSWINTFNKIRIGYTNREKGYESDSVLGYNFSATNDRIKANRTFSLDYPTVHSKEGATKILSRELDVYGQPVVKAVLETDRTAGDLLPGDAVAMQLGDYASTPIIGFVQKTQRFALTDNRIIINLREVPSDTGLDVTTEEGDADEFSIRPKVPTEARILQAPYYLAQFKGVTYSSLATGFRYLKPMALVSPVDEYQSKFNMHISNVPSSSGLVQTLNEAGYATKASLAQSIDQYDALDDGIIPTLDIDGVINTTNLLDVGEAGVRAGEMLMFINGEILSFESVTDNMDDTYTLNNVHRALLDTVPEGHADNDTVYIVGSDYSFVSGSTFADPLGYTPEFRITSKTFAGKNNPLLTYFATTTWDVTNNRLLAPLRPHHLQINYADRSDALANELGEQGIILAPGESFTATWHVRARDEAGVALQLDATQTPEVDPSTSSDFFQHEVIIRDAGGTERSCGITDVASGASFLNGTVPANTAVGNGAIFVRTIGPEGSSIYEDQLPVFIVDTVLGPEDDVTYDYLAGEAPNTILVTE